MKKYTTNFYELKPIRTDRNNIKIYFYILGILFLLFSCTDDLYEELALNNKIPDEETIPVVKSYTENNALVIKWSEDIGAEKYILYKDILPDGSFNEVVYKGLNLEFIDTKVNNDVFYYYKLAKKRGQKTFARSRYSMGIGSNYTKDSYEDNDTNETSYDIDMIISVDANIFYCRDSLCNEIIDTDWYSFTINPRMRHVFQITFKNSNITNYNIIKIYANNIIKELTNQGEFNVENQLNEKGRYYMRLEVNKDNFLGIPGSSGHREEGYILHFIKTEPIPPQ